MSRSNFIKDNGLEYLSDKDKSAIRSFSYRLRCLAEKRNYNIKEFSIKDLYRFLLYYRSIKLCPESKKSWSECLEICIQGLKYNKDYICYESKIEAIKYIRKFIAEIKNGKGLSRFK